MTGIKLYQYRLKIDALCTSLEYRATNASMDYFFALSVYPSGLYMTNTMF